VIFNKGVTDETIREAVAGCIILKGFQGVVIGEGK
jgi:alkylhydroperoxidase/carboxymuconolactone decarboxylase family protein YurZ